MTVSDLFQALLDIHSEDFDEEVFIKLDHYLYKVSKVEKAGVVPVHACEGTVFEETGPPIGDKIGFVIS
jgi:hypothetical protein